MYKSFPVKKIIESSMLIGLIVFTLTFAILSYWQQDGFSILECSFQGFVSGFIYFLLCSIIPVFFLKPYFGNSSLDKFVNKFVLLLCILALSILIHIGLEYILFQFDRSLSKDIAKTLASLPSVGKYASKEEILDLKNYPIAVINWSTNALFGLMGILVASFFIKKSR